MEEARNVRVLLFSIYAEKQFGDFGLRLGRFDFLLNFLKKQIEVF
ncbi:hypothetical protein CCANI_13285 [Corynebacterium canis]|nr:hypothetical protein CCANI_13285 [Corynebacterium canis]